MEFKGDEIFLTEKGIYEYNGVIHDDEKIYGVLANTDNFKEECFNFSEVLSVWREVDKSDCNCFISDVSEAKRKLPHPHEIWRKAAEENAIDFEIWFNEVSGNSR